MRSSLLMWSAASLLGGLVAQGCASEHQMAGGPTPAGVSTIGAAQSRPGVTSPQSDGPAGSPAAAGADSTMPEPSSPSPAALPEPAPTEAHLQTRASRVVALASQRIERLRAIASAFAGDGETARTSRGDAVFALQDIETKRQKVLQDLRGAAMEPGAEDSKTGRTLEGDVAELFDAVHASYSFAEPSTRGLPGPAPLPPSQLR